MQKVGRLGRLTSGSSECGKYICSRCKDYTNLQALSQCTVCNTPRPDYYLSGGNNHFSELALHSMTLGGQLLTPVHVMREKEKYYSILSTGKVDREQNRHCQRAQA
jgi:hypothetical protein